MLVTPNLGRATAFLASALLSLAPSPSAVASTAAGANGAAAGQAASARGSDPHSTGFPADWLTWNPPPECPNQEYIEGRITEWLGGDLPASAELEVNARLVWVDSERWEVHVGVRLNGREGLRHITVERCGDAADFVALAVVLAVNPDFAPQADGDASASAPAVDADALSPLAPPEAEELEEPEEPSPLALKPAEPRRVPIFFAFGARGELDVGTFPAARGGIALDAAVSWPHWLLSVSGALYPEVPQAFAGASGPLAFSRLVGRARGCYRIGKSSFVWGPCLSAELGTIQAGQTSGHVRPPRAAELWSAVSAGLEAQLAVLPWLSPLASLDATFPLSRPRFVLDDGTFVHRPSAVALTAAVGFRFFLRIQ